MNLIPATDINSAGYGSIPDIRSHLGMTTTTERYQLSKLSAAAKEQLIEEILEFVSDVVDELGSREEINYIHRILDEGTGAQRQLRVFHETGDLKKVVDYMIEETETGLFDEPFNNTATAPGDSR